MKFLPLISGLALCLLLAACTGSKPPPTTAPESKQVSEEQKQGTTPETTERQEQNFQSLIQIISQLNGIPIEFLENGFRDRQHLSQVKKLIAPPPVTFQKNWQVYRSRFVEPVRIKAGLAFIEQNRTALEAAEDITGVPYQVIAAIIGALLPRKELVIKYLTPWSFYVVTPFVIISHFPTHFEFNSTVSSFVVARVIGKVVGIALVGWLVLRREMIGVGLLCGMGMTVSVVITEISATGTEVESLHSGIYLASLISGLLGFIWFRVKA